MTAIDQRIIKALRDANIDYDYEHFSPSLSFKENGIDSLDVMGLFLSIEEKHAVKFTAEEAEEIRTPAELSQALDGKLD